MIPKFADKKKVANVQLQNKLSPNPHALGELCRVDRDLALWWCHAFGIESPHLFAKAVTSDKDRV